MFNENLKKIIIEEIKTFKGIEYSDETLRELIDIFYIIYKNFKEQKELVAKPAEKTKFTEDELRRLQMGETVKGYKAWIY